MRLFIALDLPGETRSALDDLLAEERERYGFLRWTSPENLHVTLRFLGDLNPRETGERLKEMKLNALLPVEFTLFRTGTFGSPPRVLWVSGRFSRSVNDLASALTKIPDETGDAPRGRFIPHVTVARAPRGSSVPSIALPGQIRGLAVSVSLYNSTLAPAGPIYERIHQVSRGGSSTASPPREVSL